MDSNGPVQALNGHTESLTNGHSINGPVQALNGHTESLTNGHSINGLAISGHAVNGHSTNVLDINGHAANGHTANGHANIHAAALQRRKSSNLTNGLLMGKKVVDESLKELAFASKAVHVGQEPSKWNHRAVIPPICLSTTFEQLAPAQPLLFEYARSGNPTRECLEQALAALERGKHGLVFSSGLAATMSVSYLLSPGDHMICGDDLYGGTSRYFRTMASKFSVELSFVDARETSNIVNALKPNTRLVWIETPTNPLMQLSDIKGVSEAIKAHGSDILLAVDNTFMSSYFQTPLDLGADIVVHSISKYLNGHSDVIMGTAITKREDLYKQLAYYQNALGAVPSPFDCFLVNRGLKTLHLRMEAHMKNGLEVAHFLESHPLVRKVLHPGLASHPQHALALKQCRGHSGTFAFYLDGSAAEAALFVRSLKMFTLAESLGGVESLIEIPSVMTHASVPIELRAKLGIDDSLVRVSVGVEAAEDLLDDLAQALDNVANSRESVKTI